MNMKSINPDTCCSSCKRYGTTPEKFPIWCSDNDCKCHQPTMNQIPNIEEERGMELILKVLPHLILGNAEELYNNPDGEMAKNTISEMQRVIRETHHQQLQKARQDWLRKEIVRLEEEKSEVIDGGEFGAGMLTAIDDIIDRYQAELNQDNK